MTEAPLVSRAGGLETLIIKWRAFATGKVVSGDDYYDGQRSGIAKCADELEAALTAIPSRDWQPIETAPKDGTPENTYIYAGKDGRQRQCRTCAAAYKRHERPA